jgi:hypothetical protein
MRKGAGHFREGHCDWAAGHTCCFSLALLLEVAMFALFQCFSIFQHVETIPRMVGEVGGGLKESSGGDEFKYNVFDTL